MSQTTKTPVDDQARQLISKDGLGQTLFVEAGAGTGKTSQLVKRIVNLVLDSGIGLADVAAITFTEAAAAELQSRIRVSFEELASKEDTPEKTKVACRKAIADADLAAISTVHGFASRILSEFSVAAGLPPRVSVLDEISSQLAHERRWERFVDRLHADPEKHELLIRLSLINVPLVSQFLGQASLKDVASNFNQNWDRLGPLAAEETRQLSPLDFSTFDQAVARLTLLPEQCNEPEDKFLEHLQETLLPEMQTLVSIVDPHRKLRALEAASGKPWTKGRGGSAKNWVEGIKETKANIDLVNDALADNLRTISDELLGQMTKLLAVEVLGAAQERKSDGGLEFHDLLVLARDMLRSSSEVRGILNERYAAVLLDEFQDTDPIQIEVASLIAATPAATQPLNWEDHEIKDGRLFFVGDAKQSIYRFRRADIKLFLKARDRFTGFGEPVELTTNFRTVAPIIDWVNGIFNEIMPAEVEAAQPKYGNLHAWREASPTADHRPIILGGAHPDPKATSAVLRECEAHDVAAVLRSVRDTPELWPIGVSENEWRPAELSDVTILIPTRTSLSFLRSALEESNIPYRLATGTLVYDTQEVRDILAVLRAIDDPTDTVSLVAALRSPFFGCSDVDLFQFVQAGGRWDIRRSTPGDLGEDHPTCAGIAKLNEIWSERWWNGPAELVGQLLSSSRANLLAFGQERPAEVWRRLRFIQDQARMYEETTGVDLRGFIDWAKLQSSDGVRVHEPLLPETDDEAVQISTIHGSKGLEFPITILSGMATAAKGAARNGTSVLWTEDDKPEVKIRKNLATKGHKERAAFEAEMDTYEKMRLLYVAATRARDHLVISAHHKLEKDQTVEPKTFASKMARFCVENPELSQVAEFPDLAVDEADSVEDGQVPEPEAPPRVVDALRAQAAWQDERAALVEPTQQTRVLSATAIARSVADYKPDSSEVDEDDDQADQAESGVGVSDARSGSRKKGRAGSAIGRAVHNTLEYTDFADPSAVEAQVERQCDLELIPEHLPTVLALVRSALESDAVALAVANKAFKEIYVAAPLGGITIEGYIDLLIETPEGLVVVDYKTDSARTEAEIDKKLAMYELQAASYAVALEETTGQTVIDCRFVFCNTRGATERSVVDLDDAKQRVRDVLVSATDIAH